MHRLAILGVLVAVAAGCKQQEDGAAKASAPATGADTGATEAASGPLTVARVMAVKDTVKPLEAWDAAHQKLAAKLGPATKVDGDKHQWAVLDGDTCAYFVATKEDGAQYGKAGPVVGMVQSPMTVAKDGPMMNRRDCLAITGKTVGPAEDPNAAAPPADGSAIAVPAFLDAAIKGRSKWKGQAVKVAGVLGAASTSTSGDAKWVTVKIKAAEGEGEVSCSLAKNADAPAIEPGKPVIASGTVDIVEWMSGGDDGGRLEAQLKDCTVAAAP